MWVAIHIGDPIVVVKIRPAMEDDDRLALTGLAAI